MSEEVLEALMDFATALEAAAVDFKQRVCKLVKVEPAAVKEEVFNILKWEKQTGSRIGEFDVAVKGNNLEDKWAHAYQVLRQNNATISSRYHGEGYLHTYWLYGEDRIYRQVLKTK